MPLMKRTLFSLYKMSTEWDEKYSEMETSWMVVKLTLKNLGPFGYHTLHFSNLTKARAEKRFLACFSKEKLTLVNLGLECVLPRPFPNKK